VRRLALSLFGALLALLILELGLRWMLLFDRSYIDVIDGRAHPKPGSELELADLIQRHPDERVVYELRPNLTGRFVGADLRTNAHGMRGRERAIEKAPGVVRIVGLGDSHAFGWGVPEEDGFYERLEALLNERLSPRQFEVWNMSVPGYNTVQEVRAFRLRAPELSPDLVVVNYVHNDMDLPNFLAEPPDFFATDISYLAEVGRRRWWTLQGRTLAPLLVFGIEPDRQSGRYLLDENRIPARYRELAGWDRMEGAFFRLAKFARAREIPVAVLLNFDDYRARLAGRTDDVRPRVVRELCDRLRSAGFTIIDPQDRIIAHLREHGLPGNALWLSTSDSHSSPLRHRLVAEELFAVLAGPSGPLATTR
jgi:hypothetical protein